LLNTVVNTVLEWVQHKTKLETKRTIPIANFSQYIANFTASAHDRSINRLLR